MTRYSFNFICLACSIMGREFPVYLIVFGVCGFDFLGSAKVAYSPTAITSISTCDFNSSLLGSSGQINVEDIFCG